MPPLPEVREFSWTRSIQSGLNILAHVMIGMTVAAVCTFAFRNGLPIGATPTHAVLCVLGYQFLMAEAILSLNEFGWTALMPLAHKRRLHWALQVAGAGLAIGGSFHKILDKSVHWNTLHGQFALVALVFTSVSLVNGLASLWAFECRRFLPSNISKITHICFGTVAFCAASVALCYGMDKNNFRSAFTDDLAHTFIGIVATLTAIVIISPLFSLFKRSKVMVKKF